MPDADMDTRLAHRHRAHLAAHLTPHVLRIASETCGPQVMAIMITNLLAGAGGAVRQQQQHGRRLEAVVHFASGPSWCSARVRPTRPWPSCSALEGYHSHSTFQPSGTLKPHLTTLLPSCTVGYLANSSQTAHFPPLFSLILYAISLALALSFCRIFFFQTLTDIPLLRHAHASRALQRVKCEARDHYSLRLF